jgi:hypothetical protein
MANANFFQHFIMQNGLNFCTKHTCVPIGLYLALNMPKQFYTNVDSYLWINGKLKTIQALYNFVG